MAMKAPRSPPRGRRRTRAAAERVRRRRHARRCRARVGRRDARRCRDARRRRRALVEPLRQEGKDQDVMNKLTDEQKQQLQDRVDEDLKKLDAWEDATRKDIVAADVGGVVLLSERPPPNSSAAELLDTDRVGTGARTRALTPDEAAKTQAVREALRDRRLSGFRIDGDCIEYFENKPQVAMDHMLVVPKRRCRSWRGTRESSGRRWLRRRSPGVGHPAQSIDVIHIFYAGARAGLEREYRERCGHLDVLPAHLPASADPEAWIREGKSRSRV